MNNSNSNSNSNNEVENFLSTIEQSHSLRITSGQVGKQSMLKSSSKTNVSTLVPMITHLGDVG